MEWQYITSKSNSHVVRLAKLKDKKYRRAEGLFRFDGIKLFLEAVNKNAPIEYVLLCEEADGQIRLQIEESIEKLERKLNPSRLIMLPTEVFSKLTDEASPEGVITVCSNLENIKKADGLKAISETADRGATLLLESVRDAGNMGTIIRSASAFGIDTLIISSDCADLYNPKTIRAAMGALFKQRIIIADSIRDAVLALRSAGSVVYAAALDPNAKRLGSVDLKLGDAILIGNEGHGLSREAIDACNECLFIPMEEGSESLNAGIAASVCMWELYKTK